MTGSETVIPSDVPLGTRCEWARMHGLDPDTIPLDYPIEIDYDARRIVYFRFIADAGGAPFWVDPDGVLMIRTTHQLESPPRPFPAKEHA